MEQDNETGFPIMRPLGDAGLMIEFGDRVDPRINRRAASFERRIRDARINGIIESVATIKSVVLKFDPLAVSLEQLNADIDAFLESSNTSAPGDTQAVKTWRVPVCYHADVAPDLNEMAARLQLSVDEVVRLHSANVQHVLMIGFAPGFLYSGLLPEPLHLPRRETITPEIPLGAVICAVGQTCIASTVMPTGWYEIGRTPLRNFVADAETPVLVKAGDRISFVPVSLGDYEDLEAAGEGSTWQPELMQASSGP